MTFEDTDVVRTYDCGCTARKKIWHLASIGKSDKEVWVQEYLCPPHKARQDAMMEAVDKWERGEDFSAVDYEALEGVYYMDVPPPKA